MILVTGGTGSLGPSVIEGLYNNNFLPVRVFALDPLERGVFPEKVEFIRGDISNIDEVIPAVKGADVVIHMAGLAHINYPDIKLNSLYEKINIKGTFNIVRAAIDAGVKRIILFSTIAVYGKTEGCLVDEKFPPNPITMYATSKFYAERIVLEAKDQYGNQIGTVIRLATVYGPRDRGNFMRLARLIAKGHFIPIGNGLTKKTVIYEKDVAAAVVILLRNESTRGEIYNITDGEIHTISEILGSIYEALGKKPSKLKLPSGPVKLAMMSIDKASKLLGVKPKIGGWLLDKYNEDVAVSGQKIIQEAGFKPKYDLKAGWEETIQTMRSRGLI